jgi:hypothetical protein
MEKDLSIYLIVQYVGKPKNPRMTSQPGYISNPENIMYEETIMVSRGLKSRDRQNGHVVLNLTEELLVKNTFSDEKDFTKLLAHYVDGFGDQINNTVNALNETT